MTSLDRFEVLPDESFHDNWEDAKRAIQNWSILEKFSFITRRKDKEGAKYICLDRTCQFKVTGWLIKGKEKIRLHVAVREHICRRLGPREPARCPKDVTWLQDVMPYVMTITSTTTPHELISKALEHYNVEIPYQQAYRALGPFQKGSKIARDCQKVSDSMRKAIITLHAYQGLNWEIIEKKTGVKSETAAYIYGQARKSGQSDTLEKLKELSGGKPSGPAPGAPYKDSDIKRKREDDAAALGDARKYFITGAEERRRAATQDRYQQAAAHVDVAVQLARAANGIGTSVTSNFHSHNLPRGPPTNKTNVNSVSLGRASYNPATGGSVASNDPRVETPGALLSKILGQEVNPVPAPVRLATPAFEQSTLEKEQAASTVDLVTPEPELASQGTERETPSLDEKILEAEESASLSEEVVLVTRSS